MNAEDVMVRKVAVCRPENKLSEVAAIMWNARCGSLPVMDGHGNVASMITDRDICIALGTRNVRASELHVQDISLPRVFDCSAKEDVRHALQTMMSQDVRRLPIVDDDGKLIGILSIDDPLLSDKSEISDKDVVNAVKVILKNRSCGSVQEPAELVAIEHAG
jgi:CBS domain-containing protein